MIDLDDPALPCVSAVERLTDPGEGEQPTLSTTAACAVLPVTWGRLLAAHRRGEIPAAETTWCGRYRWNRDEVAELLDIYSERQR